jgi:hypothetical protein
MQLKQTPKQTLLSLSNINIGKGDTQKSKSSSSFISKESEIW